MEGQLVTGQWVEILAGDPVSPQRLSGFVLSLRPQEMLVTFPDSMALPAWLEAGAEVTVRHGSHYGQHSGRVRILRIAGGPPPSVVLERLTQVDTEQRRRSYRVSTCLPVTVRVADSARTDCVGAEDKRARTRNVSASGILVETSLSISVGDLIEVSFQFPGLADNPSPPARSIAGRVVRVEALKGRARRPTGVAVDLVPETEAVRTEWARFALDLQRNERA